MRNDVEPEPGSPTVEDADHRSDAGEAGRAPSTPDRGGVAPWIRLVLALAALTVALLGSHPRVGVTVDSGEYLAVAEGLNQGEGLTMSYLSYDELYPVEADALDERVDLAHFPPAYPVLLAATDRVLPGGLTTAARWSSAIAFAITTLALTSLCRRWVTAVLVTLGVLSVDLVVIHSMAWSEPMLLASTAVAVAFALRYLVEPRRADLLVVCLAVATASAGRFIGTAIGIGIAGGLLAQDRHRWRPAAAVAVAGILPTVLWFVRNSVILGEPSERDIAWHPPDAAAFEDAVESVGTWTFGSAGWSVVAALAVVAVYLARRSRPLHPRTSALLRLSLSGAAVYLACLLVSRALIDRVIPMDTRLLAPVHLFLLIALAAVLDGVRPASAPRPVKVLACLVALCLAAGAALGIDRGIELSGQEASGYAAERWIDSPGLAYVDALPDDTAVVTNAPDAVWLLTPHRTLYFLPIGIALYTGGPNLDYDEQLAALRTALEDHPDAVVVFFDRPTRGGSLRLTDRAEEALDVVQVDDLGDATVWKRRGD